MTDDIVEAPGAEGTVDVVTRRTTAADHHPSTVVLDEATLARIGVRAGELVRARSTGGEDAYAVAETGERTGLVVSEDELLADLPVFAELFAGPGERVTVSRATLPDATHFAVVAVDPATTRVLERCTVELAGLVDAVAHDGGIIEFRPSETRDDDPPGPYYAEVADVCPEGPARVTADTRVDVRDLDITDRPRGALSPEERRALYTTNLAERPADDDQRVRLRERLGASLRDLWLLAERMPDDDLAPVFGDDEDEPSWTASVASDVVALCWLGLDLAGEEASWRVEQGIERARYTRGEDGEADVRVTRQALPSAATSLDRFRRNGPDVLGTYATLERLWASPDVDPCELYEVTREQLGEDVAVPPAELVIERLAHRAQARRFPAAQVMDVSLDEDGE